MRVLGKHVLVELYDCDSTILNNQHAIEQHMQEAALKSNATIVNSVFHRFSPHGVSGVVVIAESHLAIHTWPEYSYAAVDLFTCGESVDPWTAFEILKARLHAGHYTAKDFNRGLPDAAGVENSILRHKPLEAVQ
jgi:S-adenosylmethionine decarboxylase proenzyme